MVDDFSCLGRVLCEVDRVARVSRWPIQGSVEILRCGGEESLVDHEFAPWLPDNDSGELGAMLL
jgi:hypothetical protein